MATVTGLTKERMLEIEAQCIVSGAVDLSGHLILTQHDLTEIDAGSVKGDKGDTGDQGPPGTPIITGALMKWPFSTIPSGYLLCNGDSVLKADYPDLNILMSNDGYPWGSDSTHFTLPDYRGKFLLGTSPSHVLRETGGSELHTHKFGETAHSHTITHTHTFSDGGHTHTSAAHTHTLSDAGAAQVTASGTAIGIRDGGGVVNGYTTTARSTGLTSGGNVSTATHASLDGATDSRTPGATGSGTASGTTGGSSAANTGNHTVTGDTDPPDSGEELPPYAVVNVIIKT